METDNGAPKKDGVFMYEISKIEAMLNQVAANDAKLARFGIKKEHYRIRLSENMDSIMKISAGHVVQIWLKWPEAYPDIVHHVHNAFRMIAKHNLHRTMQVVPWMASKVNDKKWIKEHFKDESDIIFDLVPKNRLRVTSKLITTMEDVGTGEKISMETSGDVIPDEVSMRVELSRIVRKKYPQDYGDDESAA